MHAASLLPMSGCQNAGPRPWTSSSTKRPYIPFSVGPFNCAGKAFAPIETKVFLAKVVSVFDIEFARDKYGRKFISKNKDWMTWW
jgi:cytochrome P450